MKKTLLTISSIIAIGSLTLAAAEAKSINAYTGLSLTEDSSYGYLGASKALNNDLYKDGLLLRAAAGYGTYDYSYVVNSAKSKFDGTMMNADVMAGYQKYFNKGRATIYAGVNYENHDVSPKDPANRVTGGEAGLKTQFELVLNPIKKLEINHKSSYSNAFNSYWTENTISWKVCSIAVGPEAIFLGNKSFDQQRYGIAFSNINLANYGKLKVSAGHLNASRRGDNGIYSSISLSSEF